MRIGFFGTGDFSKNILEGLVQLGMNINIIVSQPNKPVGRNKEVLNTPVKTMGDLLGITTLQPEKLKGNTQFFEQLKSLDLDFIIVVAYGKIIPKEVLDIPKFGCINLHGSILPKYRGASPIQSSIKNGDSETGLTVMYMLEGMDEGDILQIAKIKIDILDKTQDIFNKFSEIGPNLLKETLEKIISGEILGKKQDNNEATYCGKIEKEDGKIDFHSMSSLQIYNTWRAYSTWPGIFTYIDGKKLEIDECYLLNTDNLNSFKIGQVYVSKKDIGIVCSDKNIVFFKKVKLEGKKSMDILSFVNGNKSFLDYIF